ncbi:MAG: hypothetical protein HC836_49540 [Richelia sp. RM2_1_2]|nr:hypothetical protein [Richelia sp. RM2_1_2]
MANIKSANLWYYDVSKSSSQKAIHNLAQAFKTFGISKRSIQYRQDVVEELEERVLSLEKEIKEKDDEIYDLEEKCEEFEKDYCDKCQDYEDLEEKALHLMMVH